MGHTQLSAKMDGAMEKQQITFCSLIKMQASSSERLRQEDLARQDRESSQTVHCAARCGAHDGLHTLQSLQCVESPFIMKKSSTKLDFFISWFLGRLILDCVLIAIRLVAKPDPNKTATVRGECETPALQPIFYRERSETC